MEQYRNLRPDFDVGRRNAELAEDPNAWIGGVTYKMAIQQFQMLYELYGPLAVELADDFILWRDERRPARRDMERWASEYDNGNAVIPEPVRKAFEKRLDRYAYAIALATFRDLSSLARSIASAIKQLLKDAEGGEIDQKRLDSLVKLSSNFQHASQGSSFHFRELQGHAKAVPPQTYNVGTVRIVSNGTTPTSVAPARQIKQLAAAPAIIDV